MGHVDAPATWPCEKCSHPAERHRLIESVQHPNGSWSISRSWCNMWYDRWDGIGFIAGACGCINFISMDNLDYLIWRKNPANNPAKMAG